MLDIKFIREHPEKVKEACVAKQVKVSVEEVLRVDEKKRGLQKQVEDLRAEQNKLTREDIEKGRELKARIKELEPELSVLEKNLEDLLYQLPNIPLEGVPSGDGSENKILEKKGEPPVFKFDPKDHLDLGEALDVIDVKRAAKVSGSRFGYLKRELALMEFALIQLAMNEAMKKGFIPIIPPSLIKLTTTDGLGYWERGGAQDYYRIFDPEEEHGGFYLVGTAEHALVPMHKDEIFREEDLPRRYVGFSSAFRREAGSYGKDTKGILRVHQFDKVEMVSFAHPDKSKEEHKLLLSIEQKLWDSLKIPYQVVQLATGDSSLPSASTIDIEAFMPGQKTYREVSSASNTTDFQARRLNIRYKGKKGGGFVHILNGTGFAIGRTLIAIMENYQQKDGSVKIPSVLQKYLGKSEIKRK